MLTVAVSCNSNSSTKSLQTLPGLMTCTKLLASLSLETTTTVTVLRTFPSAYLSVLRRPLLQIDHCPARSILRTYTFESFLQTWRNLLYILGLRSSSIPGCLIIVHHCAETSLFAYHYLITLLDISTQQRTGHSSSFHVP